MWLWSLLGVRVIIIRFLLASLIFLFPQLPVGVVLGVFGVVLGRAARHCGKHVILERRALSQQLFDHLLPHRHRDGLNLRLSQ